MQTDDTCSELNLSIIDDYANYLIREGAAGVFGKFIAFSVETLILIFLYCVLVSWWFNRRGCQTVCCREKVIIGKVG